MSRPPLFDDQSAVKRMKWTGSGTVQAIGEVARSGGIDSARREPERLLVPGGQLFVVMPGTSPILDLGLAILTGESAQADHGDRRERVLPALLRSFRREEETSFPKMLPPVVTVYRAERLRNLRYA